MNKPITLCDRCEKAAGCLLNFDGIPCRKNRTVEPTIADRIRSMNDEELAEWLSKNDPECDPPEWWLRWLEEEVSE